jgi:TDG/mug DNA glycosylase family protein
MHPQILPDIVAPNLAVLFCGINPGMGAAAAGHHFVGRNNRFWKTMHLAGFTPEQLQPENDRSLLSYGCGLTALVSRPTRSAADLLPGELAAESLAFRKKIRQYTPRFIAFPGKAGYASLAKKRDIDWGLQPEPFEGSIAWILPNPSGLNRSFTLDDLTREYGNLYRVALG